MSKFLSHKKKLISDVYEKAKKETTETSFSGVLKDLENSLKDDYHIQLSYKTFETYYRFLVENEKDYNIKSLILDDLSVYLGEKNFKSFCEKANIGDRFSSIKVKVNGEEEVHHTSRISDVIINITNSPVFNIPEFVSKHSQSFGLVGILLVMGFIFQKSDFLKNDKPDEIITKNETLIIPTSSELIPEESSNQIRSIVYVPQQPAKSHQVKEKVQTRKQDCMYWNDEKYIPIYCDEIMLNHHVQQFNAELMKMQKITRADTLSADHSLGKVWYDKSNNKVEFFTAYGVNPKTGKTLKEATKYILEKYKNL